ncbi:unnamed protein product [Polarella glacialis]|uniref:C3H1-type domain-containing protein n=1 Tax=Polarella glacialis TaxID=89957 RepID=A0A813KP81_POLGL|nr:unnamed protein product [Polarella glacialis]
MFSLRQQVKHSGKRRSCSVDGSVSSDPSSGSSRSIISSPIRQLGQGASASQDDGHVIFKSHSSSEYSDLPQRGAELSPADAEDVLTEQLPSAAAPEGEAADQHGAPLSKGSLIHLNGCRPCAVFPSGNCKRGFDSIFCHDVHRKVRGRPSKNVRLKCDIIAGVALEMYEPTDPRRAQLIGVIALKSQFLRVIFDKRNIDYVKAGHAEFEHLVTPELEELLSSVRHDQAASYSKQLATLEKNLPVSKLSL